METSKNEAVSGAERALVRSVCGAAGSWSWDPFGDSWFSEACPAHRLLLTSLPGAFAMAPLSLSIAALAQLLSRSSS